MLNTRLGQLPSSRSWRLLTRATVRQPSRMVAGRTIKEPIKLIQIKRDITTPLVLVNTFCFGAKPTWRWAGKAIATFSTSKSGYNGAMFGSDDLLLNKLQVLKFPLAASEPWRLEIQPAKWLPDLSYQVWEYRGFVETSVQQIQRVEDKINAVLSKLEAEDGNHQANITLSIDFDNP
jgi:hypothetical protein